MPMKAKMLADGETADKAFISDERGKFHLCLGNVFGKNMLKISYNPMMADENTYIYVSREQLQPRNYLKWEEELPQLCEGITEKKGNILKNIDVKGHHSNNKWKPVSMSQLRLDIDEELEDMLNQGLRDDKVVGCLSILKKYKYPSLPTRLVETTDNSFVDSVIPHPYRISDGVWSSSTFKGLSSYKEMIIRTDKATCYAYSYSERPIYSPPLLSIWSLLCAVARRLLNSQFSNGLAARSTRGREGASPPIVVSSYCPLVLLVLKPHPRNQKQESRPPSRFRSLHHDHGAGV